MNREAVNQWVVSKMDTNNLSMRKLGRNAGVPHSTISDVLSGKQNAALDFYVKIAEVFDAVPEMLQVAEVLPTEAGMKGSFAQLFKTVLSLSPEKQREAENYLRYLVEQDKQQQSQPGNDKSDLAADAGEIG